MYDDYSSSSPSSLFRSSPISRASRDLDYLLDPSYSPSRAALRADSQIYVDHAGELHDPDYRLFTPVSPSRSSGPLTAAAAADDDDWYDDRVSLSSRRASLDSYSPSTTPDLRAPGFSTFPYTYSAPDPALEYDDDFDAPRRESKKLRRRRADPAPTPAPTPAVPTTATRSRRQSIRKQWHALCLRTQVAAFRARRRVEHAVSLRGG